MPGSEPQTLFEKMWGAHVLTSFDDGTVLLYIDRLFLHEGSRHAFSELDKAGLGVRQPGRILTCSDHYVTTTNRHLGLNGIVKPDVRETVAALMENAERHGIAHIGMSHPSQGILHVVGPEKGVVHPGFIVVGNDSHTCTHGAFGAIGMGIGTSDVLQVLATQTLWQRTPKTMRVTVEGRLSPYVTAKDLALFIIRKIGFDGAIGHAVEYAGETIAKLSMEGRMTLCNLTVEAGGRAGIIAPDETTFAYLKGRSNAPQEEYWDTAVAYWMSLRGDPGCRFDTDVTIDASEIAPTASWGTDPSQVCGVNESIPLPEYEADNVRRERLLDAVDYMGLTPGQKMADIDIDRVFIGSCTNSRIEDLRLAAEVARHGSVKVPAIVVPGSTAIKQQAEAEGLDRIFLEAGFEWRDSGCSLCTTGNGEDILAPGERCASTSNRNFKGRQGPGGRTHLVSPATAVVAAFTGKLGDVRAFLAGRT